MVELRRCSAIPLSPEWHLVCVGALVRRLGDQYHLPRVHHPDHAEAQAGDGHRGGARLRPVAAQAARLRRRAQPGLDQPDRQRRRRHGRHGRYGRPRPADGAHRPRRPPCAGRDRRQRPRHSRGRRRPCPGALLHHQAGRQGHRAGLDIGWRIVVQRHHGDVRFTSTPRATPASRSCCRSPRAGEGAARWLRPVRAGRPRGRRWPRSRTRPGR
jgi:hypothetical protein